jgi:hypothetical protein
MSEPYFCVINQMSEATPDHHLMNNLIVVRAPSLDQRSLVKLFRLSEWSSMQRLILPVDVSYGQTKLFRIPKCFPSMVKNQCVCMHHLLIRIEPMSV